MDWAKAKTILIAVFLGINIFLGYMIIGSGSGSIGRIDSRKIQETTEYLTENKINVKTEVPDRKTDLPPVTVKYKLFKKDSIVKNFFPPNEEIEEFRDENGLILNNGDIQIQIMEGKEFYYQDNGIKPSADETDERTARKNIDSFIEKLGIKPGSTRIISAGKVGGYSKYVFEQLYRGFVIYNSRMEFYVNNNGIHKAGIVWFDTVKQANKTGSVVSSLDALSTMFDYYKENIGQGVGVLGIEQGYYFGIGVGKQVDTSKIEEGTAFPVWKITTDRDLIYVNGYNKHIEGLEKAGE